MAKGSEQFAWKLFPGQAKVCWQCGREGLRVQDVAEHRTLYPFKTVQFLCKGCAKANVDARVEETRKRLGFSGE